MHIRSSHPRSLCDRLLALAMLLCFAAAGLAQTPARLVVGSEENFPPFALGDRDEAAGGFTVELWKAVAAECGLDYTIRVRPFRQILEEFKEGKIDVLINLAQSDERRAFADFSVPHVIVHGAIFVRKGTPGIQSEADLAGKSIIVISSDLAHDYAVGKGWEPQLVLVDTVAQGMQFLASGQHDAMLVSKLVGMQTLLDLQIRNVEPLTVRAGFSQKFSFAVQKGNATLLAALNEGLALVKSDGTYDGLYERSFGIYEAQEITARRLLKYLWPAALTLLLVTGFFLVRQHERAKVERQLRESEDRFRRLIDHAPEAIVLMDCVTGRFVLGNPAAEALFKLSAAELRELGPIEMSPPVQPDGRPSREAGQAVIERAMAGETPVFEWTHRDSQGRDIACEVRLLRMEIGGRAVVRGSVTDITARRRVEIEREQLERRAREAQKLESLGVLAGGIAHDFNNLLTSILGNASIATMELPPGSSVQDCLDQITQASMRAADLCKQMLAYSGRGRFMVQKLDLGTLVEQASLAPQSSLSSKIALHVSLGKGLPPVDIDASQIRQVIANLITNASEAIGDRPGAIRLATGMTRLDRPLPRGTALDPDLPEGDYVHLEVTDDGCGMSVETQARIFDPFFTTKFTGRGLGLAAVLGIVRGHHGGVIVHSEEERGTTVKILLPPAAEASGAESSALAGVGRWQGVGPVLVVDDEASMRATVARMMHLAGIEVVPAVDGREAVEIFRADPARFALVLLDLTMPHMGGEETFIELRRLRPDVRVVLMSGYNAHDVLVRFDGKGLASFLQKPFTMIELRETLGRVLGENGSTAPASRE